MIRTVIHINEELCSGCGLCASACKEGAIAMVNGKARLIRDDYCDGLGNCLPVCPVDAIHVIEREAAASLAELARLASVRARVDAFVDQVAAGPEFEARLLDAIE